MENCMNEQMIDQLMKTATKAKANSHSPYTKHRIFGAAILCHDGTVIPGCSVENAVFPMSVCAIRSALTAGVSNGHKKFRAVAMITNEDKIITPCGICREALYEFTTEDIYCAKDEGNGKYSYKHYSLRALMPEAFATKDFTG